MFACGKASFANVQVRGRWRGHNDGLHKTLSAVKNIRGIGKRHMLHNDYTPHMDVDAQTYAVRADGQLLTCEPASVLPMAQRYFLF